MPFQLAPGCGCCGAGCPCTGVPTSITIPSASDTDCNDCSSLAGTYTLEATNDACLFQTPFISIFEPYAVLLQCTVPAEENYGVYWQVQYGYKADGTGMRIITHVAGQIGLGQCGSRSGIAVIDSDTHTFSPDYDPDAIVDPCSEVTYSATLDSAVELWVDDTYPGCGGTQKVLCTWASSSVFEVTP